jgi:DNA-binding MarR family transcriptional regulator
MAKPYYKIKNYDSQRSIGYLLRKGGKLITANIEALFVGKDITAIQWIILMNLRAGNFKTAAEICQSMCHDSGALTRMLDQMEKAKLIARARSKQDRRVVEIALTSTGLETTDLFLPAVVDLYNYLLEDFSKSETDILIDLLIRLNTKLLAQPLSKAG